MNLKLTLAAGAALFAVTAASSALATSSLTVGDTLDLQYQFPNYGNTYNDSGPFTYTGPGQSLGTQYGITTVILSNNVVDFSESPGCGSGCYQTPANWNGPVLYDLTNGSAFNGWKVLSDTVGITGYVAGNGVVGVNWQGVPVQGSVLVGVPEPGVWAMMLVGLGAIGGAMRSTRRRAVLA
ncbi:MAG: PEPxxWA-CTERM sorting domain-containing protein [Caulobacteraceae bacterium]|nr:PEPxxWA-CTERM sorting domain-containing protein [Caulobacteraceae bacterium]